MSLSALLSNPALWHSLGKMGGAIAQGGAPSPVPVNPFVSLSKGFSAFGEGQREYEDIAFKRAQRKRITDENARMDEMREKLKGVKDPNDRAAIIKSYYPKMEVRAVESALNRKFKEDIAKRRMEHDSRERAKSRGAANWRHSQSMKLREKMARAGGVGTRKSMSDRDVYARAYENALKNYATEEEAKAAGEAAVRNRNQYFNRLSGVDPQKKPKYEVGQKARLKDGTVVQWDGKQWVPVR